MLLLLLERLMYGTICFPLGVCVSLNTLLEFLRPTKQESVAIIPKEAMSRWPWRGCLPGAPGIFSSVLCAARFIPLPLKKVDSP